MVDLDLAAVSIVSAAIKPATLTCLLGLNVEDLTQRTLKFFGPGSEYDTPVNNPYREKGGRQMRFSDISLTNKLFLN